MPPAMKRILCVDDYEDILEMLASLFGRAGYDTAAAPLWQTPCDSPGAALTSSSSTRWSPATPALNCAANCAAGTRYSDHRLLGGRLRAASQGGVRGRRRHPVCQQARQGEYGGFRRSY